MIHNTRQITRLFLSGLLIVPFLIRGDAWGGEPSPTPPAPKTTSALKDPCKDLYAGYTPPYLSYFVKKDNYGNPYAAWNKTSEEMKLSSETSYFTLNQIEESDRANALVEAGIKKEIEGQHREALKLYQIVIDKYSDVFYRVCDYGIFMPVGQYCQRRILNFPPNELAFYRTKYDAKAKEAFEQAKRKNSMSGMAEIVESMLATSYGDNALVELGSSALDAGNFLEALEYFLTLRDFFHDSECRTPDLDLKITYCEKMLGDKPLDGKVAGKAKSPLLAEDLVKLKKEVNAAHYDKPKFFSQQSNAPYSSCDDYTPALPTIDPLAINEPVWNATLPGSRRDLHVYTQPVVTDNSIFYRYKNIIYCHSILNGELRWSNDLGGRVVWQNWNERQYPQEDLLAQDGMVVTPILKVGASLAALDGVTGQLRWAYGPMSASNEQESHMRFEAAPAGGNRTVFAGYIQDNIEGETHTDSEYGLMAFESTTGRVAWRASLCRLQPGKFSAGFVTTIRNRIRSFSSPPLYSHGTVYYNTNAGAMVAMDGRSGTVKWLMRYPYYPEVHDATRQFGSLTPQYGGVDFVGPHNPMFWLNQKPMLIGENLYVTPVDSPFLFCIDRRTGKVLWSKHKMGPGFTYLMGTTSTGELVVVTNGRAGAQIFGSGGSPSSSPVFLLNPKTGETVWPTAAQPFGIDLIMPDMQPVMSGGYGGFGMALSTRWFETVARPYLDSEDRLFIATMSDISIWWRPGMHVYHLTCFSLKEKKILFQRRYYSGETLAHAMMIITDKTPSGDPNRLPTGAPAILAVLENSPTKDANVQKQIEAAKAIAADKVPENKYGPFMPFSRMTFERFGVPFELRFSPRSVAVSYDKNAVKKAIDALETPSALFARSELALNESRLDEAAALLNKCLAATSSEDQDFRSRVNQQLYQVHLRLAQSSILAGKPDDELKNCLGMTRTACTLAEEIQTLFALADAYEHKMDYTAASRCLRQIVTVYGHHEYPIAAVLAGDQSAISQVAESILSKEQASVNANFYSKEMSRALSLMKKGLPLYFSTVSPLPKSFTVRAGELAQTRMKLLRIRYPDFVKQNDLEASKVLEGTDAEEQEYKIAEFPGTPAAQKVMDGLFQANSEAKDELGHKHLWTLADKARSCGLKISETLSGRLLAPETTFKRLPLVLPHVSKESECADSEGTARLVLQRKDDGQKHPQLAFLGGRKRTKTDNKFVLTCLDLETGKNRWETADIRFLGNKEKYLGEEWGFFEAFVVENRVVVFGLYDVFAFNVSDGKLLWRFRVPSTFEIKSVIQSGDLLVLAGQSSTMALYIPTANELGEVAWQENETGDQYIAPYFLGDRLISVRKLPFNVTTRFRATGKLLSRLSLPDLTLSEKHPLIENGPLQLPVAHDGELLAVTDGYYYMMIDVNRMTVLWKRLVEKLDLSRELAMRFYLKGDYLAIVKEDFDFKTMSMLSSRTGAILWSTYPKNPAANPPLHSILIEGEKTYGIQLHPGQGFYLMALETKTGKRLYAPQEVKGYQGKPVVHVFPEIYGTHLVIKIQDNRDFEVRAFDIKDGKEIAKVAEKGDGSFGVHGRISATVQNGRIIFLSKDKLKQ